MLINGEALEGTYDYECTDSRLKLYTGACIASCITRFRPVVFPHGRMIYKLLLTLHNYHLCCFLTEAFALFVASKLDSYYGIAIFVAMTNPKTTHVLCWLLQHLRAPHLTLSLSTPTLRSP